MKNIKKVNEVTGKGRGILYGCELFTKGVVCAVAIPNEVLKSTGKEWFKLLQEKNGKAQTRVIKGLLSLMCADTRITIVDEIKVDTLREIAEKYGLANLGYAFEQYFVNKGCKHGDDDDDKINKRDVYIKAYWTAGRTTTRGYQLKCSIAQASTNF